jgi:hypothetical protein
MPKGVNLEMNLKKPIPIKSLNQDENQRMIEELLKKLRKRRKK